MNCETCIMENRIKGLEDGANKQADDKVESAKQMTAMQKDIEQIFVLTKDMNKKLDSVIAENQKQKLEQAASKNEAPAQKWTSLSTGTRAIIITVIGSTAVLVIGYLFKLLTA